MLNKLLLIAEKTVALIDSLKNAGKEKKIEGANIQERVYVTNNEFNNLMTNKEMFVTYNGRIS